MERGQTLQAIARIEAALDRLEAVADPSTPASDPALQSRHDDLRDRVSASLAELDALIGALEK
ncbi:MAG: hypothetical protein PHE36_10905 [Novosphingobium sp.]|nr:hypothetical protein [Novosphingobium sp.]